MDNSGIQKYYLKQRDAFEKYVKKLLFHQHAEDIHQLRLAIKKMRTLMMLIELTMHEHIGKKRDFHIYLKLFKTAGRVRETQLNIDLLKENSIKKSKAIQAYYKKHLKQNLHHFCTQLAAFKYKQHNNLHHKLEKKIKSISLHDFQNVVINMLKKELSRLHKLIRNNAVITDLHKMRIRIRVIKELIIILNKIKPSDDSGKFLKNLKSNYISLGSWHDHHVLAKSLESISALKGEKVENQELDSIIVICRKKEAKYKNRSQENLKKQLKSFKHFTNKRAKLMPADFG